MSHCRFKSKTNTKKLGTCSKQECTCNKNICFCSNLHAPFTNQLPGKLPPGTCITITGWIKEDCPRFAVNLACSEGGDVALHLNPRLVQKYIARNCRIKGKWQVPEVTSVAKFELERNRAFQISILLTTREFLIAVDGKHFCAYVFRVDPDKLKILQVLGSVKVHKVEYQDLEEYPPEWPTNVPVILTMGENLFEDTDGKVELPLAAFLAKGFRKGCQIEIVARIKIYPSGFFINLQEGSRVWPLPDLHLHVSFSFDSKQGKHKVVVSARLGEIWRTAITVPRLYFQPTCIANIAIHRSSDCFMIWLDGELLETFPMSSSNADMIDTLYIQGDISILPPVNVTIKK